MNADRLDNREYLMPAAEALLAASMALMTGHAQSRCDSQQEALAQRIVDHLRQLGRCTDLSPTFRPVLRDLLQHWQRLCAPMPPLPFAPCQWQAGTSQLQ